MPKAKDVSDLYSKLFVTSKDIEPFKIDLSAYEKDSKKIFDDLMQARNDVENNTSTWQKYFDTLGKNEKWQEAFVNQNDMTKISIDSVDKAQKAAKESAIAYNKGLGQMTIGAKAADFALKGLALAGNVLVSIFVAKAISTVYEMAQASNTVGKAAQEAASQFSSASSDIDGYKKKIEDLYKVINGSSSSIEEVTDARKQLLEVQDEMIEKFGKESVSIDLVTKAIDNQKGAIEELTRKQWLDTLNDFNKSKGFGTDLANGFSGYDTNLDRAKDEYFNYSKGVLDFGYFGDKLPEFKQALKGLDVDMDDTFLRVNGNANEVYQTLLKIQETAEKFDADNQFLKSVGTAAEQAKSISDKYKSFLDQYTLNQDILPNDDYKKAYKNLTEKYAAYQRAFESGDEQAQDEAIRNYAQSLSSAMDTAKGNSEVVDYFKSMYPAIQKEVSSWMFEINFTPNVNGLKDNVEKDLKVFNDKGFTTESFEKFDVSKSNDQELIDAYNDLQASLQGYGGDVTSLISTFEKLGLLVSESKKKLLSKYDEKDVNSLSQEDLDIAYKVDNKKINSWDELIKKIREYKKTAEDTAKAKPFSSQEMIQQINGMSEGFEELDKIMNSIKDKDKPFDYSLLDDKKFTETFQGLGKEYTDFVNTISNSPKDIKGCQSAFNDLVTKWVDSTGILDHVTSGTADLTTAMLTNMGISNAEELVTKALADKEAELAAQKYITAHATDDLSKASLQEYVDFLNSADASDVSKQALARLELAKIAVNGVKIDTSSDIDQVIALANAAGVSAAKLEQARDSYKKYETVGLNGSIGDLKRQEYSEKTVGEVENGTFDWTPLDPADYKKAIYDGGVKTNTPSKGSGSKDSTKEPTQFDWIERKLTLIDKQTERLKTKINDLVGYKNKNAATDTVIDLLNDKMTTLEKSAERYQEELSKIDIPQEYIDKIKNGDFSVDNIAPSDKALADKIKNYQDLYDKMVDCTDQITETKSSIKELNLSELDNIINQFDQLADIQSKILNTQQQILELNEKAGETISASDYLPLVQRQLEISKENAQAYDTLAAKMAKMNLEQNTDEWKKYNDQLQEYKNNMLSAASAVEEYKDSMTELVYKELDDFKSKMDSINSSISTMSDLIGTTDLVDDNGKLTDRGIAQVALYAQQMSNAKQEAAEYAEAIDSLDEALNSGLITQDEYNSMLYEYTSAQESAVKANKEARDSILSLVKNGIQAEIDAKKELIDQTKAALEAEQDLHEYQESISEKSSNIAKLERQIAALENSTDRADMAKKLQLQQDLADAQKDLYDTQYDHEMEQRKSALDDEYDAFEEAKNKESDELDTNLDKQEAAIKDYLEQVKSNYSTAYGVLKQYGDDYSLSAIDSLTEPWDSSSMAAETCADAIGDVTANIQYEIDSLDFSSLYELVDLLNQIGINSDYGASNYQTGGANWKWQQGKGGRWWYGEDYDPNGDYDYASGGIYTIKGKQYAFDDDGYMITGWNDDSGEWRYFEPENGEMVKDSWRQDNGKWYYLDSDGVMARDTAVKAKDGNGYWYVGEDGAWDGNETTDDNLKKFTKKKGYAKGTTHATGGWHMIDEAGPGSEVIMTKYGELVKLNDGDGVFTKEQTDRLYNMLTNPDSYNPYNSTFKVDLKPNVSVAPTTQNINVEMNVGGVVDEATLRIMEAQFPNMIKKNSKLLTNTVGDGVSKSLMGKRLSSRVYNR